MQEKQARVLEVLKEMQKQEIFTILKSGTHLDKIINEASGYEDISSSIQDIKEYINDLEDEFTSSRTVSIGVTLAGFNDKFQYELHNMYLAPFNQKEKMHVLETDYGKDNPFTIALKSDDVRFTLEERKLIKLINHYYINLKTDDKLKDKMFYIPINDLKRIYPETINHKIIKEGIITACERINGKRISWDLSKTRYATNKSTNLKELKLDVGKNIKLVSITPIYSQYDKKYNLELKGILCKTNKFLDLRFKLKQISYLFPTEGLRGDYLSYSITEMFTYHMNLKNNKKRGYVTKLLRDVANEIYYEEDGFPTHKPYWSIIKNSQHKQRKLLDLLSGLTNTSYYLTLNKNYKSIGYIVANTVPIKVLHNGKQRETKMILNELSVSKDKYYMKEINAFTSALNKKNVTLDDLLLYKYPKQFDYEQLKPMKNKFIDANGNIDIEKIRALLVADVKLKENVIKSINHGNIEFKIKMAEN